MNIVSMVIFNNNFSISFFYFTAKDSLLFFIDSISCFKFSSTYFGQSKLKQKVLESLITIWYQRYSISLISFFNLHELFPAFICAYNVESLVNSFFGLNIFNPVPSLFLFWGFHSTLWAIFYSESNFTSSPPPSAGIGGKSPSSKYKSIGFQAYLKLLCFSYNLL